MRIAVTVASRTFSSAVARCSQMIAKGFAASGCQTELVVTGNWKVDSQMLDDPYSFTCFAKTSKQNGSHLKYLRYMRKKISQRQWDALLVYSVGLSFPLLVSHARRKGIKILYFQGDRWEGDPSMPLRRRLKIATINAIDGYLARHADLITLGGSSLLRQHFERIAPGVKVFEQWTPTDTELFAKGDGDAFRKTHRLQGRKLIVYCGSIHALEGVDVLVKAMTYIRKRRDDATLVLAGRKLAHDILRDKAIDFVALSESLGLQGHVLFTGLLGLDEVRNLLHAANVLVMPKIDHKMNRVAAPIKLPEYLSSNKPVVASRVGDISKYLRDGQDVLFCKPSDPEDLADKILRLLDDPSLAERIGASGARVARERMDHRVWAQKVLQKIGWDGPESDKARNVETR